MKTKTLRIILAAIALVSFVLAVYCIVVSLKGTGEKWGLPAALGLAALGNLVNLFSMKKNKGRE